MDTATTENLLNRYVSKGGNREYGTALLAELVTRHEGNNLVTALVYWGFATEARARKVVGI